MNYRKWVLTTLSLLMLLSLINGCATTRKDFKPTSVKPNEGTVIGRVVVHYNEKNFTPECSICFNSINGPCQKLLEDSIVVMSLPQGTAKLSRVACQDGSLQHFNIDNATFNVKTGVNYFGEINIHWQNAGGYKISSAFGAIGAMISESTNDGKLKMFVSEGDIRPVVKEYELLTKQKPIPLQKNLLKVAE